MMLGFDARFILAAGIEFTNGDQPGVRLTKAAAKPVTRPKNND